MHPADLLVSFPLSGRSVDVSRLGILVPVVRILVSSSIAIVPVVPIVSIAVVAVRSSRVTVDGVVYRVEEGLALDGDGEAERGDQQDPYGRHRGRVVRNCVNSVDGQAGLSLRKLTPVAFNREWCRVFMQPAYISASDHPTADSSGARAQGSRSVPWSRIGPLIAAEYSKGTFCKTFRKQEAFR